MWHVPSYSVFMCTVAFLHLKMWRFHEIFKKEDPFSVLHKCNSKIWNADRHEEKPKVLAVHFFEPKTGFQRNPSKASLHPGQGLGWRSALDRFFAIPSSGQKMNEW